MDDVKKYMSLVKNQYDAKQLIFLVLKKVIVDITSYVDLSRKILYMDTRSDSLKYDFSSDLQQLFGELVKAAQQQDILRSDIASSDIAQIVMGVYYQALLGWPDIGRMSEEECNSRIEHLLDLVFYGFYKK